MTKDQALKHYGTQQALATVVGVTRQAVMLWGTHPPPEAQMKIHKDTAGKLQASAEVLKFYRDLTEGVL